MSPPMIFSTAQQSQARSGIPQRSVSPVVHSVRAAHTSLRHARVWIAEVTSALCVSHDAPRGHPRSDRLNWPRHTGGSAEYVEGGPYYAAFGAGLGLET